MNSTSVIRKSIWDVTRKAARPARQKKGQMRGPRQPAPAPTPEEHVRIAARRIAKAERDERVDITLSLTPVRTYMGGFTRPKDLRASNWLPGGRYNKIGKVYETPPEAAYEPHTVFLLESRYPVAFGIGRPEHPELLVLVCREGDFEELLRKCNSRRPPHELRESMENARWPWRPKKRTKKIVWWEPGENPKDIIQEAFMLKDPDEIESLTASLREAETSQDEPEGKHSVHPCSGILSRTQAVPPSEPPEPRDSLQSSAPAAENSESATSAPPSGSNLSDESPVTPSAQPSPSHNAKHRPSDSSTKAPLDSRTKKRDYYEELAKEPFWRPLLSITLSTRPLALTLARLSRALARGQPFYASISNDDRKAATSFGGQLRCMRIARMQDLAITIAEQLAGARGGFIGIRFSETDRGRGILGEGLEAPVPFEKRVIKIGVADWYPLQHEIIEFFTNAPKERPLLTVQGDGSPFEVFRLDDYGRRTSVESGEQIPWPPVHPTKVPECLPELQRLSKELEIRGGMDVLLSREEDEEEDGDWGEGRGEVREGEEKKGEFKEGEGEEGEEGRNDGQNTERKEKMKNPRSLVAPIVIELPELQGSTLALRSNPWRRDMRERRQELARKYCKELARFKCQQGNGVLYP